MKSIKIFTITLLFASLVAGCQKNDKGHIRIFAENIGGQGAKVAFNPADIPSGADWIANETINLNGNIYTIAEEQGLGFYLTDPGTSTGVEPLTSAMHAIYPGQSFDGNSVSVTNSTSGNGEIVLDRLVVEKVSDTIQKIAFPMAAEANADATKLYFKHLTGGFRLTLNNTSASAVNVASVKIVARSTAEVTHLGCNGVTARWAVQGPSVPSGPIGSIEGNVDVKYACEMNFDLRNGGNNYINIPATNGTLMFCVPITISSVRYLTVTGYDANGTELFNKTADLGSEVAVERNRMYTIPQININ